MSRENVELVRRIYEAATRRDASMPFELYGEDIVWDLSRMESSRFMSQRVFEGHEGVRQAWREGLSVFDEVEYEVEELIDAEDRVIAVVRERDVGRASRVPVEGSHLAVWTLCEGKIVRMQVFHDRREAERAAGLSP